MSDNIFGSLIGLIGIILALVTHMIIKELTFDSMTESNNKDKKNAVEKEKQCLLMESFN